MPAHVTLLNAGFDTRYASKIAEKITRVTARSESTIATALLREVRPTVYARVDLRPWPHPCTRRNTCTGGHRTSRVTFPDAGPG